MTRALIACSLVVAATCWTAGPASAQQASNIPEVEAGAAPSSVAIVPNRTSEERWLQAELEEASQRSRRTRNALIATSATFALGAILAGIGASQCEQITSSSVQNYNDLACNRAGDVLLPLGGTMAGLSFVGMLTSGIMLGVANKRRREIKRDIRRVQYGRRLQWDIPSGGLVF